MTTWTAPPLSVDTDVLELARLERFRWHHPDVRVLSKSPVAWIGGEEIKGRDLRDLLDKLESRFPPVGK